MYAANKLACAQYGERPGRKKKRKRGDPAGLNQMYVFVSTGTRRGTPPVFRRFQTQQALLRALTQNQVVARALKQVSATNCMYAVVVTHCVLCKAGVSTTKGASKVCVTQCAII
jgi:hypothetical protein